MMGMLQQSRNWFVAARPKTWVAAFLPVAAAGVLASRAESFNLHLLLCAFVSALCLQIATNFWNDYFDDLKGSDGEKRIGPRRLLQLKLATRSEVLNAALFFNTLSLISAIPIFMERGWALLPLGVLCLGLSISYTGGPFPLAYLGLGELFVLIFFGWVATFFGYFVATGLWSLEASVLGVQVGLLSCVLITINNIRDSEEDEKSGKNTLVVRWGRSAGLFILAIELIVPYFLNIYWWGFPQLMGSFLSLPLAFIIFRQMKSGSKPNRQLALASLHALIFLALWAVGILL